MNYYGDVLTLMEHEKNWSPTWRPRIRIGDSVILVETEIFVTDKNHVNRLRRKLSCMVVGNLILQLNHEGREEPLTIGQYVYVGINASHRGIAEGHIVGFSPLPWKNNLVVQVLLSPRREMKLEYNIMSFSPSDIFTGHDI